MIRLAGQFIITAVFFGSLGFGLVILAALIHG